MHSTVQRILSRNLLDRDKNRRAIGRQTGKRSMVLRECYRASDYLDCSYGIGKMGNDNNSLVSLIIASILFYSNLH
jgi:hypothetical protein